MKNKMRHCFAWLGLLLSLFVTILLAPFRTPIKEVRKKMITVRQPRRRMSVFMAAFALLILFCLMALPALAGDGSFGTTNQLVNGAQYNLYPTNATGIGTGTGIDVRNYKSIGFYFSGDLTNSTAAVVGVSLVRSDYVTTAGITNWETASKCTLLISLPALTNHFDWETNLPEDIIGPAVKVGISAITNNLAAGQQLNNLDAGVIKKIIPLTLSPR